MSELLEEVWHFDSEEEKVFEIPVKIDYGLTAPEGFSGVYFPTMFIDIALAGGKEGFCSALATRPLTNMATWLPGQPALQSSFRHKKIRRTKYTKDNY